MSREEGTELREKGREGSTRVGQNVRECIVECGSSG